MSSHGKGQEKGLLRQAWEWLTGQAYRPERHYMRGRPAH